MFSDCVRTTINILSPGAGSAAAKRGKRLMMTSSHLVGISVPTRLTTLLSSQASPQSLKLFLQKQSLLKNYPVAARFSWAANRTTKRVEDRAYCLLGIFDIGLPLLYGEGIKAFRGLQEEIIKHGVDHSILAWRVPPDTPTMNFGALVDSPRSFQAIPGFKRVSDIENIIYDEASFSHMAGRLWSPASNAKRSWVVTARGLEATLPLLPCLYRGEGRFYLPIFAPCRLAVLNISSNTHVLAIHVDGYKRNGSICWRSRGDRVDQLPIQTGRKQLKNKDEWENLCRTVYVQLEPAPRSEIPTPIPESVPSSLSSLKKFLS